MKTLYLECNMGAAGDMLCAALFELIENKKEFLAELSAAGIPKTKMNFEPCKKCGITGTRFVVTTCGRQEDEHMHDHHGHHHGTSIADIEQIVSSLKVSKKVKKDILGIYSIIASAESKVHGEEITQIHFHEVGTMDALADAATVCLLMEKLNVQKVFCSPVHVGYGSVKCAHGILPVPAPATAQILTGIPIYSGKISGELCTPTGAAILKYFVDSFGDMPVIMTSKTGYGMGTKDFEAANCVRAILGETPESDDVICELKCNLDDMTAEKVAFACERLFEGGAVDVYTVPIGMKKSRPGVCLCVMCAPADKEKIVRLIFKHTSSCGIRETICKRYILEREIQNTETPFGNIRLKRSHGYGTVKEKFEYDDLCKIARANNISIDDVLKSIN